MENHKFQINLSGIIDLLSNHLYSSPQVFLRELLQNGVDAIRSRENYQPEYQGTINIEIISSTQESEITLMFADDGVGLTEEEIHRFLSTIGESSKREDLIYSRNDFLGQFGIGLLSCFMVTDEIVMLTRSIKANAETMEWRGSCDGTYSIRALEKELSPGTRIFLRSKSGYEDYFQPENIARLAHYFGSLLPYPIIINDNEKNEIINKEAPPWKKVFANTNEQKQAMLNYGREVLGIDAFDCIPLKSPIGGIGGIAFVLPYSPSPASQPTHKVYLKNMLLSERVTDLLPEWAFFVKCIINVENLRPTASRESFYEDGTLAAVRGVLAKCLQDYLIELAQNEYNRLQSLISLHYLAIKSLAIHDDEFYRLFINLLPFETSMGRMTMGQYREHYLTNLTIRYVATVDQFRQIARVAASQSICVINAGYVYDLELLEKFSEIFPEVTVERLDASAIAQELTDLTFAERETTFRFLKIADIVLQSFKCSAQMKKFLPAELPAIYSIGEEGNFQRSLLKSQEVSNSHWSSILGNLDFNNTQIPYAQLCFNWNSSLVQKLVELDNHDLIELSIQTLYVQSLLLGHHPLNAQEMNLLNNGLLRLIEFGIDRQIEN